MPDNKSLRTNRIEDREETSRPMNFGSVLSRHLSSRSPRVFQGNVELCGLNLLMPRDVMTTPIFVGLWFQLCLRATTSTWWTSTSSEATPPFSNVTSPVSLPTSSSSALGFEMTTLKFCPTKITVLTYSSSFQFVFPGGYFRFHRLRSIISSFRLGLGRFAPSALFSSDRKGKYFSLLFPFPILSFPCEWGHFVYRRAIDRIVYFQVGENNHFLW